MIELEPIMLRLLPGTCAAEQNGRFGLALAGRTCLTADSREITILRALLCGARQIEELKKLLRAAPDPPEGDAFAALTVAAFILHFGEYLKTEEEPV